MTYIRYRISARGYFPFTDSMSLGYFGFEDLERILCFKRRSVETDRLELLESAKIRERSFLSSGALLKFSSPLRTDSNADLNSPFAHIPYLGIGFRYSRMMS